MSFGMVLLRESLRTQLLQGRTWLLLFLLPLMIWGSARLLPAEEVSTPVEVGVVLPEEGGEEFWTRLEERSGLVVTFHQVDYPQAERQVAAGRWDCAVILPEDFLQRMERQEVEGLFTLLVGPGSAAYPMVRETAAACTAELVSPGIAERYLLDSSILSQEELDARVEKLLR